MDLVGRFWPWKRWVLMWERGLLKGSLCRVGLFRRKKRKWLFWYRRRGISRPFHRRGARMSFLIRVMNSSTQWKSRTVYKDTLLPRFVNSPFSADDRCPRVNQRGALKF